MRKRLNLLNLETQSYRCINSFNRYWYVPECQSFRIASRYGALRSDEHAGVV